MTDDPRVRRMLREPLLHFVLLGLVLFLVHGWIGGRASGEGANIVITPHSAACPTSSHRFNPGFRFLNR